ncbi:hypothetical protein I7E32_16370 [Alcaligenes faecalis]|nr:hypothetical protein [Alcaligenes faecalis]
MSDKWCYSFNEEYFHGEFDSREEVIKEAIEENKDYNYKYKVCQIGKSTEAPTPGIDVTSLLENIVNEAIQDLPDGVGNEYLDNVTKEHAEELEEELNEVLHKWFEKYGYKPTWFVVNDFEEIELT